MIVPRLRADKPRRALPGISGAEATSKRFSAAHLRNLLKRGVTVVVVSGIAVAGFGAFTTSSTNSIGTAFADSGALAIASIPAVAAASGTAAPSLSDLAAERAQQLSESGEDIVATQQDAALDARTSELSGDATMISKEIERLKSLGKFLWPTEGGVGSPFGYRMHPILHYMRLHDGDDIGGKCGQPIYAAQTGVVVKAAGGGYNGGSGNNVRINHGDINGVNVQTAYLHMTSFVVNIGEKVDKGQLIGHVGSTGLSTACHLHFSLYKNGRGSDPMEYIGWNPEANRKGQPN
ncbi:MAG TPA: M23 family metallopeptidase, partial [Propionicimonas sp.]|nr:M23 family metallopeptidase [Propionicimonas sp.]